MQSFRSTLLVCSLLIIVSCGEKKDPNAKVDGKLVYERNCALCHGSDGKLGSGGAKDLAVSTLGKSERVSIIRQGGKGMTPFKGVLEENEIDAVADYIESLRK